MIALLCKIWRWRWLLRSMPSTIRFNLHYLPLSQAVRLPVILYKPRLLKLKGRVMIEGQVRFGQILLGQPLVSLYPNDGVVYENHGGTITFRGNCAFGNHTAMSIGPQGHLVVGADVCASAGLRLACHHSLTLENRVRLGWEVTMLDTDFHSLTRMDGGTTQPARPVVIGENSWLGYGCTVLKGTMLPPYTTVSARTVLNRVYDFPPYSVVGDKAEVVVRRSGVYRDLQSEKEQSQGHGTRG